MPGKFISDDEKAQILALVRENMAVREISARTGRAVASINRLKAVSASFPFGTVPRVKRTFRKRKKRTDSENPLKGKDAPEVKKVYPKPPGDIEPITGEDRHHKETRIPSNKPPKINAKLTRLMSRRALFHRLRKSAGPVDISEGAGESNKRPKKTQSEFLAVDKGLIGENNSSDVIEKKPSIGPSLDTSEDTIPKHEMKVEEEFFEGHEPYSSESLQPPSVIGDFVNITVKSETDDTEEWPEEEVNHEIEKGKCDVDGSNPYTESSHKHEVQSSGDVAIRQVKIRKETPVDGAVGESTCFVEGSGDPGDGKPPQGSYLSCKGCCVGKNDPETKFGDYVAAELRALPSDDARRWAKWKIQSILYEAYSQFQSTDSGLSHQ